MTAPADVTADELAASVWDVIVIGAGPAGAVAAFQAARVGLRTLLVDAKRFPRPKTCGGCLSRSAADSLQRVGLAGVLTDLLAPRIDRVSLCSGASCCELPFAGGYAVDRSQFDMALARRAAAAGVAFSSGCAAKVLGVTGGRQRVELSTPRHTAVAATRVAVVADGLLRSSMHAVASAAASPARRSRIGVATILRAHHTQLAPGVIEMTIAKHGYAGQVLLDDRRSLVAAAVDRTSLGSGSIGEAIAAILGTRDGGLRGELLAAEWQAAPPLTRKPARIAGERWFAVGDAAGYVEPFTGDGMATAIETGLAVTPWLEAAQRDWDPKCGAAWTAEHRRIVGRRRRLCHALAWTLRRPWAVAMFLSLCRRAPQVVSWTLASTQPGAAGSSTFRRAAIT